MRAPLVEAEQHGSIRIEDLTKVVMTRRLLWQAKERLVPFEAARNVTYADDGPCSFHSISAVAILRRSLSNTRFKTLPERLCTKSTVELPHLIHTAALAR